MKLYHSIVITLLTGLSLTASAQNQKVDYRYRGMESTNLITNVVTKRPTVDLDAYVLPLVQRRQELEKEGAAFKAKVSASPERKDYQTQGIQLYDKAAADFQTLSRAIAFDVRMQRKPSPETLQAVENCDEAVAAFIGHTREAYFLGFLAKLAIYAKKIGPVVDGIKERNHQRREKIISSVRSDLSVKPYGDL